MAAAGLQDQMKMVIHQNKSVKLKGKPLLIFIEDINEQGFIFLATKDMLLVIAPGHRMVGCVVVISSSLRNHGTLLS